MSSFAFLIHAMGFEFKVFLNPYQSIMNFRKLWRGFVDTPKRYAPGQHFNRSEWRSHSWHLQMSELMTSSIPAPEAKAGL